MLINADLIKIVIALQIFGNFILKIIIDPVFTATFLTILILLFSCVYSIRTSAINNMHNSDANFLISIKNCDKNGAKIRLYESYSWRDLASKLCIVATQWFYAILCIGATFLISLIYKYSSQGGYKIWCYGLEILFVIFIILSLLFFISGIYYYEIKKDILEYYLPLEDWDDLLTRYNPDDEKEETEAKSSKKLELRNGKLKTTLLGVKFKFLDCSSNHRWTFYEVFRKVPKNELAENVAKEKEAHIWYCLAARSDERDKNLDNLRKAINLDPALKEKAKNDKDFKSLWNDKDFKSIVK